MIPEKEREALMRLTMCARIECLLCKYRHEYNDEQCRELQTKCMNILANALNKDDMCEVFIAKEQEDED